MINVVNREEAYTLLKKAEKYIPEDPEFKQLKDRVAIHISILSEPGWCSRLHEGIFCI